MGDDGDEVFVGVATFAKVLGVVGPAIEPVVGGGVLTWLFGNLMDADAEVLGALQVLQLGESGGGGGIGSGKDVPDGFALRDAWRKAVADGDLGAR